MALTGPVPGSGSPIDLLAARGLADRKLCSEARERVVRIVRMLTKPMQRFER